jgi:hypothetical protein
VGSLTEPTQRVLEAASALGREFRLASLTVLVGHVGTAVAEAVGAGILESFDGVLRFTHILICDELCAALTLERRSQYHRAAATNERDPVLGAPHWLAGGRLEDSSHVFTVVVEGPPARERAIRVRGRRVARPPCARRVRLPAPAGERAPDRGRRGLSGCVRPTVAILLAKRSRLVRETASDRPLDLKWSSRGSPRPRAWP